MKTTLLFLLFIFSISFLNAQIIESVESVEVSETIDIDYYKKVELLIEDGLNDNLFEISSNAKKLTSLELQSLYKTHKRGSGWYSMLNVVPGFGIGSWIQGDFVSALVGTLSYSLGLTAIFLKSSEIGAAVIAGSWIYGIYEPVVYSEKYNYLLKGSLGVSEVNSFSVYPTAGINSLNQTYAGVGVTMTF